MATVGVFGLNMTPQTGGTFRLLDTMMVQAARSRHRFLYLSHDPRPGPDLPSNVRWIGRPASRVRPVQAVLNVPGIERPLARGRFARWAIGALSAVDSSVFGEVDVWLWPHTCAPIPFLGRPMVPIAHDLIHHRFPDEFSRRELRLRRSAENALVRCAAVLCPSQTSKRDLLAAYPELEPLVSVFSEAPTELWDPTDCEDERAWILGKFGDSPLFVTIGFDWPHKNHALLLDVAHQLAARGVEPRPRIVFVGHRKGNALARAIRRAGLEHVVSDVGPVSRKQLVAFYTHASALLFPSRYEGFGIPLVEAMHYGVPIVASDAACIPEIVGDAGVLLPPDDVDVWARAIEELVVDPPRAGSLAAKSRGGADRYSWARTWSELDAGLETALGHL